MVQVDGHLIVGLVHVQHATRGGLRQALAVAQQGAQRTDLVRRSERAPQQARRVQVAQPLAIGYVALAFPALSARGGR